MSAKKKEEPANESDAAHEEGEGEGGKKKGKKKLLFIIIGVVILIVVGVVFSGVLGGGDKKPAEAAAEGEHGEAEAGHGEKDGHGGKKAAAHMPVYYELPQFLVNLSSATGRTSFLKMGVTLELRDAEAVPIMDANKPRVMDTFNTYLRELRASDIQGSAGVYRLRDELMKRLNGTIEEGVVKDILFSEIIVQ
jgi:flagellar FliL protein